MTPPYKKHSTVSACKTPSAPCERMSYPLVEDSHGVRRLPESEYKRSKYPEWLPVWDPKDQLRALEENTKFVDRALFANPKLPNLFPEDSPIDKIDLSPKFGTEVRGGLQLSSLNDKAKDELALLLAQRGFVVFRKQDLKDKGFEFNKQFAEHFGPLHTTSFSGAPENELKFHVVYRTPEQKVDPKRVTGLHTDDNWEVQTPGVTIFAILEGPPTGGDTLFVDSEEVYERLSPRFKEIITGFRAVHSNLEASNVNGEHKGFLRTPPTESEHPLVRIHPVTQKKNIYFSFKFTTKLTGLDEEESALLLNYLKGKVFSQPDLHLRARWEPGTVVLWDNRRCLHSAVFDSEGHARHCYRVTTFAETPVENFEDLPEEVRALSDNLKKKLAI